MNEKKYKWPSKDPGDQFSEENWKKWPTEKKIAFMQNFHDQLVKNDNELARKLEFTEERLRSILDDIAQLKIIQEYEQKSRN
jgi:hypothetical protein